MAGVLLLLRDEWQCGELKFPFELCTQISVSLNLVNATDNYVAFKVKTTAPKDYCLRPNTGLVLPHSSSNLTVTMRAQGKAPPDMRCEDKFLVLSVIAPSGSTVEDVSPDWFEKESRMAIHKAQMRALYVASPPLLRSPPRRPCEREFLSNKRGEVRFPFELLRNHLQRGELKFPFEWETPISCSLRLVNETDNYVAFKVKTTAPKDYCVRPHTGLMLPQSNSNIIVTTRARWETPPGTKCKDQFLVESMIGPVAGTVEDVSRYLFDKQSWKYVYEVKLGVRFLAPPHLLLKQGQVCPRILETDTSCVMVGQ